jgi:hypothetical protein
MEKMSYTTVYKALGETLPVTGPDFDNRVSTIQDGLKLFMAGLEDAEDQQRVLADMQADAKQRRSLRQERKEAAREVYRLSILVTHTRRYLQSLVAPSEN